MKRILSFLVLVAMIVVFGSLALFGLLVDPTSSHAPPASQLVSTNASQALLEVLTNAVEEPGASHQATKMALAEAYNTSKSEAPEVAREFLLWRGIRSAVWLFVFLVLISVALYFSWVFRKLVAECPEPVTTSNVYGVVSTNDFGKPVFQIGQYVLALVALVLFLSGGLYEICNIAKIFFTPRLYVIEYVVNAGHTAPTARR